MYIIRIFQFDMRLVNVDARFDSRNSHLRELLLQLRLADIGSTRVKNIDNLQKRRKVFGHN